MRPDFEGQETGDSTEALLWQALSLTRSLIHEMDDLEIELGEGATRPMIEPLNNIDERIFFALFAFVPGMHGEDEERAMARDQHFHERFGDLPSRLGLAGTPAERIHQLLREIRRRIGAATIRLDVAEGDNGEFEALDELELALDAVTDLRHELERITRSPE
ncbi:MAG: hypothetical protein WEE66_11145 [Actinomycetota bacterium]